MDREKIKSLLGQAILRVNEVVPDFEDLDKQLYIHPRMPNAELHGTLHF